MFRSDVRHVTPAGPTELPPYYAQRLQAIQPPGAGPHTSMVRPAGVRSARHEAAAGSPEAQAERLFRDFKLGLMTLVIVTLLLLAYFWDGGTDGGRRDAEPQDDVLSFSITGRRRADVLPYATDGGRGTPSAGRGRAAATSARQRRPRSGAASGSADTARPRTRAYVYTVKSGDTLSAIALRFYGDASLWKAILTANSRRLGRASDLRVGMKLIVPVKLRRAKATSNPGALARAGPVRRE
jgi:nucleoid-associated protein YgaU